MRQKTKDYILDISLKLFNENGIEAVSTRAIAQNAGISQGNLCYHYPQKEQIVEALYYKLVDEITLLITNHSSEFNFEKYFEAAYQMCILQNKYKFLMLNFVHVMRTFPEIKQHFQNLFQIRKSQFISIYKFMEEKKLLKKDNYNSIINYSYIIGDFWIAEAEILFQGTEQEKILHYTEIIAGVIYPYLTEKGQSEYSTAKKYFFSKYGNP